MNLNNISSVLLLGIQDQLALPVIRTLGSVLGANTCIHSLAFKNTPTRVTAFSKHLHSFGYLQSTQKDELCAELLANIEKNGAVLVLPIGERYVRLLSILKPRLEKHICLPPLPKAALFDSLVNKRKLHQLLQKYNFRRAETSPLNRQNAAKLSDDFFPCIIKPVRDSAGRGIKKIENLDALFDRIDRMATDNYIIQEYIPGRDIDCSLLAIDGDIKAFTIQRGLKSRGFRFSKAIKFEHNEAVFAYAQRLIKKTGYSGLAHLDFRLDERDNQPKLIDFNARFWSSLLGSKAAGVDFALLTCLAAVGIPFEKPKFTEKTYLMGIRNILDHYRQKLSGVYSGSSPSKIHTDLPDRIHDPLPEFVHYINRLNQFKKLNHFRKEGLNSIRQNFSFRVS